MFHYRLSPHQECGKPSAELMFGRNLNSRLSLIFPHEEQKDENNNVILTKIKQFEVGERVVVREYLDKNIKWRFGTIIEKLGRLHCRVQLSNERIWKRHINQMRAIGPAIVDNSRIQVGDDGSPIGNSNADQSEMRGSLLTLSEKEKLLIMSQEHPEHRDDQENISDFEEVKAPDQPVHLEVLQASVMSRERPERKCKPPKRFGDCFSY